VVFPAPVPPVMQKAGGTTMMFIDYTARAIGAMAPAWCVSDQAPWPHRGRNLAAIWPQLQITGVKFRDVFTLVERGSTP
jgi:hypothetical protein